ncbi:MAG: magnesium transporter [Spirochaetota bacterium]
MKNPLIVPEIRELLKKRDYSVLESFMNDIHEKEAAEFLSLLKPSEIWKVLNVVERHRRAEIFSYMDMDVQVAMISTGQRQNVLELLLPMSNDDRADLFLHLDPEVGSKLMTFLPQNERSDILKLTSYDEGTIGAMMTSDYVELNAEDTVEKSIKKIRKVAPGKETIYYTYICDENGVLTGFISLRKLILASPQKKVKDIMKTDVIYAYVNGDQEEAANMIVRYDLLALPVVDSQQRLQGIVTYDDAIDIIREEQTEDMERLMAISGPVEERPYLEISILTHFRKRVVWVIILGIFGILTGLIIQGFQNTLETLIILAFYMPLLNAAGGNTGSQSATVVLRSLALNQLTPADTFRVVQKEFVVAFCLSICLGLMTFGRVILFSEEGIVPAAFSLESVALVIGLALAIQVIWSTVFGAIIPMIATRINVDPAVFSSPALTTLVDMGGIVIYFGCAHLILGI